VITSAGTVGIGTISPAAGLEIKSTTANLAGTINVTSGSVNVTGTGTKFLSDFVVGGYLFMPGIVRQIASISSDTAMTMTSTAPVTFSPASYNSSTSSANRNFMVSHTNGRVGFITTYDATASKAMIGIGTAAVTNSLGFAGDSPQTIGVEQNPGTGAGQGLSIRGGGAGTAPI
jgi:hypothetical protein